MIGFDRRAQDLVMPGMRHLHLLRILFPKLYAALNICK
jgi:hypothetical protein